MIYNLDRFRDAQRYDYATALAEIRAGRKNSHWIWYIFPQLRGLGRSWMSDQYGIDGIGEAQAYWADDVLRGRLTEITEALLALETNDPRRVMDPPDDMKLRSCMTLFREAAPECPLFQQVLDKYFGGRPDHKTLGMLQNNQG